MENRIELKLVQNIGLEILSLIHEFCEANDIMYCLGYGTLIGAIRHHGFIPWDDDIDINMPRPDYEKFCKSFPKYIKNNKRYNHLAVRNASSDPCFFRPFTKVIDTRTEAHEPEYVCDCQLGVFVDIWPIDGLPKTAFGKAYGKLCQRFINRLFYVRMKKTSYLPWYAILPHFILSIIPIKSWTNIVESMYKRYSYEECDYCMAAELIYIRKEMLSEVIMTDFEDRKFYVPREYDFILKYIYGDYMTMPPVEKRSLGHTLEAYWINDQDK